MKKPLVLALVGLLNYGCVTKQAPGQIPCLDIFKEISRGKTELGVNDCSNKGGELIRRMRERGIRAHGLEIDTDLTDGSTHMVVQIRFRGEELYLDPQQKKVGTNLKAMYGENCVILRKISDFEIYHDFEFRKVYPLNSSPIR